MARTRAWAAATRGAKLKSFEFDPGPLGDEEVEIAVEWCGICHSDISMIDNDWASSAYPLVPGHEAVGRVLSMGAKAKGLHKGQRVGVGWNAGSCMHCRACLGGDQHLCNRVQATIVGRHGGFAERVRSHWAWAVPIPEGLDASAAGPLLCGGVTVFSPMLTLGLKPTQRVGVVGIGGLGHMALKFLRAWGCEVTAFTSSAGKRDDAIAMGAHQVVSSRDPAAMRQIAGSLDLIIFTLNVSVNWDALLSTLAPKGRLHMVGAVLDPIPVNAAALISGDQGISGSPTGSRPQIDTMLDFAARHKILPQVEHFPMSRVNDAIEHLRAGRARYRIVLDADFD
jgi:alcohol/geraniol dehydrogenase (NADP+)